ncbi:glycoside hydrolase family 13 protein [Bacillus kwashiorkori]|uniref:glycoside hydrolase family 13 protein n=1 Tax=Bacillus kwashiorkori TaxID=1522318 RepID=UPI000784EC36|nr:alpha-glucosidase [Bacillus kwashiorkori]
MKEKWWKKSVVYQVYPKSFYDSNNDGIGDLRGVIEKLDYLADLGIDLLWLSPVYQSPMDDNGYDISDYYQIAEQFGTMADMEELIREADKRNIKIMMDLVINHTSDEHSWFLESKSSRNNPKRDWYIWRNPSTMDGEVPTNWRSVFGGSAWEYDEETGQYYLHTFSKKQPDINWENKQVRREIYQMINWWLDKGIGGFRVDAITFIKKSFEKSTLPTKSSDGLANIHAAALNQPGIDEFLQELKVETFAKYDIATVAEAPGVSDKDLPKFVGDNGHFNMLFEFSHVDLDLGPEGNWYEPVAWTLKDLKEAINKSQAIFNETGWGALYIENHDHPRSINKFIRNENAGVIAQKMLAIFYFFMKGTPFIYQGQEIGMTNVEYPSIEDYDDLASIDQYRSALKAKYSEQEALKAVWRRSRDNARTPMQWNDSENAGFSQCAPWLKVNPNFSEINVKQNQLDPDSLLHFYKKLISLRKNSPYSEMILYGQYEPILESHPDVFAYKRIHEKKDLMVLCNFSNKTVELEMQEKIKEVIVSNYKDHLVDNSFALRPYEAVLCEVKK